MKIISKFKDYYDYLVGIYGEDSNLVLDRRKTDKIDVSCLNDTIIEFYIGGYKIQGFAHDSKIYYGDDIKQFKYNRKKHIQHCIIYIQTKIKKIMLKLK